MKTGRVRINRRWTKDVNRPCVAFSSHHQEETDNSRTDKTLG